MVNTNDSSALPKTYRVIHYMTPSERDDDFCATTISIDIGSVNAKRKDLRLPCSQCHITLEKLYRYSKVLVVKYLNNVLDAHQD